MSITWSTAAQGAQVIPVLLIHGVPAIFYPAGVSVSALSITSPDTAWWPGNTYANWTSYGKPWLSLRGDGITITQRAQPTQPAMLDVSEVTLYLDDINDGTHEFAATAFLSSSATITQTYLAASLTATGTTITVTSTSAFAASGTVYLDQEAITYSGKTGTTFTGCTRGAFGSRAVAHTYDGALGTGLGNPVVLSSPDEIVGRPATVWLAQIVNGTITAVSLEHYGTIGTGAALVDEGEGWVLHVDHAIKRLGQKIVSRTITVGGYVHTGALGARTTLQLPTTGDLSPFFVSSATSSAVDALAILTGDSAAPDRGGWHPSRETFVADLNAAGQSSFVAAGGTFSATLDGEGVLTVAVTTAAARALTFFHPWASTANAQFTGVARWRYATPSPMPKAYVPIFVDSPVYLTQGDYAIVPAVPTVDAAWAAYGAEVYYCLVMEGDDDDAPKRVAKITANTTASGTYYLTCTAINAPLVTNLGYFVGFLRTAPTDRGGPRRSGFIITDSTKTRIGLYVRSSTWPSALKFAMQAFAAQFASVIDAIDFDDIEDVAASYPSVIPSRREMVLDLDATPLEILGNEAALNGFALTMKGGRVSIVRIAEFAVTEATTTTLASTALHRDFPTPGYSKGEDGIVNVYTVRAVDQSLTINVVDNVSASKYGTRDGIECSLPRGLTGASVDASRLYAQIAAQGAQVIGPHRYPYEHVTVRVPLHLYGVQVGDLLYVSSLWRVPNRSGGRGITDQVAQVVAREVSIYGGDGEGWVSYTLRLNPTNVEGYAPSALIAAGGISGGVCTLDTSTFGTGGFAGTGSDGGASTFLVGDHVRLVEIDATSPTASTQHDVTAVSGSTITLSPSPSATFATLAASSLKVMVIYDDWSVVSGRAGQAKYAFLADSSYALDGSTPARIFAA